MSASGQEKSRAELFDILGHPSRVSILEALGEEPLGFAGLKRKTGIASNGLLSFHLGKMGGLVCELPEGGYTLTNQGKEALAIIEAVEKMQSPRSSLRSLTGHFVGRKMVIGIMVIVIVIVGSFALAYGGFVPRFGQNSNTVQDDTLQIGNTTYWYKVVPADSLYNVTSFAFHGVVFRFLGSQLLSIPPSSPTTLSLGLANQSTCTCNNSPGFLQVVVQTSQSGASPVCYSFKASWIKGMFYAPIVQLSTPHGENSSFVADLSSSPATPGSVYTFGPNGTDSAVVLGDGTPSFAANRALEAGVILDSQSSLVILLVQE